VTIPLQARERWTTYLLAMDWMLWRPFGVHETALEYTVADVTHRESGFHQLDAAGFELQADRRSTGVLFFPLRQFTEYLVVVF
jgi:hypothetical protein